MNRKEELMLRFSSLIPLAAALSLGIASGSFAATGDQDWQMFEQSFGGPTAPKATAECARYATSAVKVEGENRIHRGSTFTYYATGDHRKNAEEAAQKYCGMLGKTADVKG